MEDIIPFLIVALISIVGAASRKKKKRNFSEGYTEKKQQSGNDDFLSWMERLSGIEEDEPSIPYQPQQVASPVSVEEDLADEVVEPEPEKGNKSPYANFSGFITPDERQKLIHKEAPSILHEEIQNEPIKATEISSKKRRVDFDLRKAVIFSEILNRKYS